MPYPAARRSRRGRTVYGGDGTPAQVFSRIHNLVAGMQQYYEIPTQTAAGDFELEFEFYGTNFNIGNILLGNSLSSNNGVFVSSFDIGARDSAGTLILTNADIVSNSTLNTLRLSKSGNILTINLNGTDVVTGTSNNSFVFDRIAARRNGELSLTGFLRSVNFISGFTNNGQPSNPLYPLDDTLLASDGVTPSTVIRNSRAVLGPELIANTWVQNRGTIVVSNNGLTLDMTTDATTLSRATQASSLVEGEQYIAEYVVRSVSNAEIRLFNYGTGSESSLTPDAIVGAVYTEVFTATTQSALDVRTLGVEGSRVVIDVSFRQADNYATAVNLVAANTERVEVLANGDLRRDDGTIIPRA